MTGRKSLSCEYQQEQLKQGVTQVERKTRAVCIGTLLSFGRRRNRSLTTGVNRSKREAAPLPPFSVKAQNEWTCRHSAQGTS